VAAGGDPRADAGVYEGQILAGKYRVERVLGIGGMGVVVKARHVELDHPVALKFLLPDLIANTEAVARFGREARAAARIMSEHVARVLDVGTLDNGAPYMVMEFLEGGDLADWLRARGPLSLEQAVDFVLQACVAVADAHGLGIVHRDLKPANLFWVRRSDGQLVIKVLDFGISKVSERSRVSEPPGLSVTRTSAVIGSPLYMSPEQVQSAKNVDARTDIWALGVILFEFLAGVVPFPGEAFGELAVKISVRPTPSLRAHRPEVPPALEAAIARCLEKEREARFRNVAELAMALLPFAPRRAKSTVERVSGIIHAAGLSASALTPPPSPPASPYSAGTETTQLAPEAAPHLGGSGLSHPVFGTIPPTVRALFSRSNVMIATLGTFIGVLLITGIFAVSKGPTANKPAASAMLPAGMVASTAPPAPEWAEGPSRTALLPSALPLLAAPPADTAPPPAHETRGTHGAAKPKTPDAIASARTAAATTGQGPTALVTPSPADSKGATPDEAVDPLMKLTPKR